MKAAICYEYGQPLVVEDVELAAPRDGEVRVRLAATAVCHSDVHLLAGDWPGVLPVVAGHEAAGIVEEIGPNVTTVKRSDRVVVSLLRSCGRCFQCTNGSPHTCVGLFALDQESRLRNRAGQSLTHGIRTAAFAESVVVEQSQLAHVPDDMPLDCAALLGCGVITGVGAVRNTARVQAGQSVVIIGAGGVGLNAIQGAVLAGANPIIAVDRVESKLIAAQHFGATHVFNGATTEPKEIARAIKKTIGRGADYVFVTVGSPEAAAQAQGMLRPGGTIVIVGMPPVKATVALKMFDIVWNEHRIIGSRMGSTRFQEDVPRLVEAWRNGKLRLEELISARYPLEEINEAIASMSRGQALRNLIVFSS